MFSKKSYFYFFVTLFLFHLIGYLFFGGLLDSWGVPLVFDSPLLHAACSAGLLTGLMGLLQLTALHIGEPEVLGNDLINEYDSNSNFQNTLVNTSFLADRKTHERYLADMIKRKIDYLISHRTSAALTILFSQQKNGKTLFDRLLENPNETRVAEAIFKVSLAPRLKAAVESLSKFLPDEMLSRIFDFDCNHSRFTEWTKKESPNPRAGLVLRFDKCFDVKDLPQKEKSKKNNSKSDGLASLSNAVVKASNNRRIKSE